MTNTNKYKELSEATQTSILYSAVWISLLTFVILYVTKLPESELFTEHKIINTTTKCVGDLLLVKWDSYDINHYNQTGSIDLWEQNIKWKIDSSNVKCKVVDNCIKIINKKWNTDKSCFDITKSKYRI